MSYVLNLVYASVSCHDARCISRSFLSGLPSIFKDKRDYFQKEEKGIK